MEPIRYGVVGLGRAGWEIHVRQLRNRPDMKIVAVVDPVQERRDQAAGEFGCKTYDSLGKMLKQADVEVVVIATPSQMHGSDTKKALKAGKHVVVEKPMAVSLSEADSMIRVANETGRKLFVHQNYRFFPEYNFLKDVIDSGIIGKVHHIRNNLHSFNRRNDWQTLAKNGGGVLNNTCPHFVDQILQFLGSPVKQVVGDLKQVVASGDVEDHVKAFIRAENGCTADMEISSCQNLQPPLPKWIFTGNCGTMTTDGKTAVVRYFDPSQVAPLPVVDGPAQDRKYGNADKLPWQEKTVTIDDGWSKSSFYDNVTAVLRRDEPMRVTPESVREVIRVMGLIRKSSGGIHRWLPEYTGAAEAGEQQPQPVGASA